MERVDRDHSPVLFKGDVGNKPYPLETMLWIHMLQNLYGLSDIGAKYEVLDSRAFSEFCGVKSSNQVPDGDTIGRFRAILIEHGLQEQLFAQEGDPNQGNNDDCDDPRSFMKLLSSYNVISSLIF